MRLHGRHGNTNHQAEQTDRYDRIRPIGLKQSRKTQTVLPTCQEERCHFVFNVICRAVDGAWFLSKQGSGREHINHPQDLNLLTSTLNMDDATRKLIHSCTRVSATPSTAMRLAHLMTGEKHLMIVRQCCNLWFGEVLKI
jgi:hypothetical protein